MDTQSGWIIVIFEEDNSIEAVPNIWLRKGLCAWPKSKGVKKIIEKRIKPNNIDFNFYNARQIGKTIFSSLTEAKLKIPKAILKSDISSAEDNYCVAKQKIASKRLNSLSPNIDKFKKTKPSNLKSKLMNSCPPRYKSKDASCSNISSNIFVNSDSDDSNNNSNNDPSYREIIKKTKIEHDEDVINNVKNTPEKPKLTSNTVILYSPVGNWKVTPIDLNKFSQSIVMSTSPKEIEPVNHSLITKNKSANSYSNVKRQLLYEESTKPSLNLVNEKKLSILNTTPLTTDKNVLTTLKDFQSTFHTSQAFIKHELQGLVFLCQTINDNVEKLMKEKQSVISVQNDDVNMDMFPIKNENELQTFEEKIKDSSFRNSLLCKISLFIGNKDLGNSVRRIMLRMFDDKLLTNYSLYGFKKKKSFCSLLCYRLILDALRTHIKYKHNTEKEIEIPLGTWLSHAPFRIKTKNKVEEEQTNNID